MSERSVVMELCDAFCAKAVKAYLEASWRPIAEADKSIVHIFDIAGLSIANSLPIWARDIDGRIYEALWSDDGKRSYWWDIEGESPVDPVEFMPHPLSHAENRSIFHPTARDAFKAGWKVNAAAASEAQPQAWLDGCEEVDWQEYLKSGSIKNNEEDQ